MRLCLSAWNVQDKKALQTISIFMFTLFIRLALSQYVSSFVPPKSSTKMVTGDVWRVNRFPNISSNAMHPLAWTLFPSIPIDPSVPVDRSREYRWCLCSSWIPIVVWHCTHRRSLASCSPELKYHKIIAPDIHKNFNNNNRNIELLSFICICYAYRWTECVGARFYTNCVRDDALQHCPMTKSVELFRDWPSLPWRWVFFFACVSPGSKQQHLIQFLVWQRHLCNQNRQMLCTPIIPICHPIWCIQMDVFDDVLCS